MTASMALAVRRDGSPAGKPTPGRFPPRCAIYDTARDFQPGVQRAAGAARAGQGRGIEFAGALTASTARSLVNAAAERSGWAVEALAWRTAELDPAIAPGAVVRIPDRAGLWRIESWEWRERGVELELRRLPPGAPRQSPGDPGDALAAPDLVATPSLLLAYELPWDGLGNGQARQVYAAASSESAGWTGAALYAAAGGKLAPLGGSGPRRSRIGRTLAPVPSSAAMLFDRHTAIDIELVSEDFLLTSADVEALAQGANRALVGNEVLQFAEAAALGGAVWRLRGLLRGRGGTEASAREGHPAEAPFALLDDGPIAIDPARLPAGTGALAAIGLVDPEPVLASIVQPGLTQRPLTPVHPRVREVGGGDMLLQWTRRSRGAWHWLDGVETPLNEEAEVYQVGVGNTENPVVRWQVTVPQIAFSTSAWADLAAAHSGQPLWVRQIGSLAASPPLLLTTIA